MRNANALFWREAARSLPLHVQARYAGYFESAQTWESALDDVLDAWTRLKQVVARRSQTQAA